MTQEEKSLSLKDLCVMLPYDVCVHIRYKEGEPCYGKLTLRDIQWFIDSKIEVIKPYLRPMSSMTEEEKTEIDKLNRPPGGDWTVQLTRSKIGLYNDFSRVVSFKSINKVLDYLNAHHFDYRGLIEKGLALEAPKGMYNVNEK